MCGQDSVHGSSLATSLLHTPALQAWSASQFVHPAKFVSKPWRKPRDGKRGIIDGQRR